MRSTPASVVYLPPPNIHVVEAGETLYSVSRRYNVDTRSLALLNGIARPWTVWPGDELLLPPLARDQARATSEAVAPAAGRRRRCAAPRPGRSRPDSRNRRNPSLTLPIGRQGRSRCAGSAADAAVVPRPSPAASAAGRRRRQPPSAARSS